MTEEQSAPQENQTPETKPTITFDDFTKLDLRIGTVKEVADHPNADKLLVLQVDLGGETRQIIAGLKQYCAHEDLLGRQIVVVTNLEPRKMRGLESQGMLLAASTPDRSEVVAITPDRDVPPGSSVS